MLLRRLRWENCLNLRGRGCSELRLCHCTLVWATESNPVPYYELSVIWEKGKGWLGKQFFNPDETGLFYKDIGKLTYTMQIASKTPGFKSLKDYAINHL